MRSGLAALAVLGALGAAGGCVLLPLFEGPGGTGGTGATGPPGGGPQGGGPQGGAGHGGDGGAGGVVVEVPWVRGASVTPVTGFVQFRDVDVDPATGEIVVVGVAGASAATSTIELGEKCTADVEPPGPWLVVAFYDAGGACTRLSVHAEVPADDGQPIRVAHAGATHEAYITNGSLLRYENVWQTVKVCEDEHCGVFDIVRSNDELHAVGFKDKSMSAFCGNPVEATDREALLASFNVSGEPMCSMDSPLGYEDDSSGNQSLLHVATDGNRVFVSGRNEGILHDTGTEVCGGGCTFFDDDQAGTTASPFDQGSWMEGCGTPPIAQVGGSTWYVAAPCDDAGMTFGTVGGSFGGFGSYVANAKPRAATGTADHFYAVGSLDANDDDLDARLLGFVVRSDMSFDARLFVVGTADVENRGRAEVTGVATIDGDVVIVGNYEQEAGALGLHVVEDPDYANSSLLLAVDLEGLEPCANATQTCRPFIVRWNALAR